MNPFSALGALKLFGSLALVLSLGFIIVDWHAKRADVAALHACEKAIAKPGADISDCPPPVAVVTNTARASQACDAALLQPQAQGGFAIETSCSVGVKQVLAGLAAAQAARDAALVAEKQADDDRDGAIARAEQRAHDMDEEVTVNAQTISAAPRNIDGSVRCDAACLHRLAD